MPGGRRVVDEGGGDEVGFKETCREMEMTVTVAGWLCGYWARWGVWLHSSSHTSTTTVTSLNHEELKKLFFFFFDSLLIYADNSNLCHSTFISKCSTIGQHPQSCLQPWRNSNIGHITHK